MPAEGLGMTMQFSPSLPRRGYRGGYGVPFLDFRGVQPFAKPHPTCILPSVRGGIFYYLRYAKLQAYASLARRCLHGEWPGYVWSVTGKKGMIERKIEILEIEFGFDHLNTIIFIELQGTA